MLVIRKRIHFVLVSLLIVLSACSSSPTLADQARGAVNNFLQASQAGNIDLAYSWLINLRSPHGQLKRGGDFLSEVLGEGEAALSNKAVMSQELRENNQLVERKIIAVNPVEDIKAKQFWVIIEEAKGDRVKELGEIKYLVVETDSGWRIDMARSDFSKAIVISES